MRILVTFATEIEFAPWRRFRQFRAIRLNACRAFEARIHDADVQVLLTGVGPDNARRAVRSALSDRPSVCISAGLAGGLRPEYPGGAILAAREVREARTERAIQASPGLLESARERGARQVESFLTVDRVLSAAQEKRALAPLADAVEMESFPVLAEACAHGIRVVAIRAIGDAADEDLPLDFNGLFDARGHLALARLAGQVLRHPGRLPALIRLGRRSRRATARLVNFLDGYVRNLSYEDPSLLVEPALEVVAR